MAIISGCRICGYSSLEQILSFGEVPLANALVREDALGLPERTYPLELVYCPECSLVQITETVPPEELFSEYPYFSSYSDTMLDHSRMLVDDLVRSQHLTGDNLAMEIASNDGYLLQYYKLAGVPVLGIEPAANIARSAIDDRGITTICEFFGLELARRLRNECKLADVLHAHNVLAHVVDLHGFVEGMRIILKDNGMAVIEVPYLRELIDKCEFDTIYHEHLCYFALTPLIELLREHGLVVADVRQEEIHGGSLRLYVAHAGGNTVPGRSVEIMLEEEERWGVGTPDLYRLFAERVSSSRSSITDLLLALKAEGHSIAAYGASAKGCVLLNSCGIGKETIDFIVDRSRYKQGLYMPGTLIRICSPDRLLEYMPDYVLLLTWNFAEEIIEQQSEYLEGGGRFIIPIPVVKVVRLEKDMKASYYRKSQDAKGRHR